MYTPGRAYKPQIPCSRWIADLTCCQMTDEKTLTIYLNDSMRKRAEAGKTNVINRIVRAFDSLQYRCLFKENSTENIQASLSDPGYSLFHLEDPFHPRALNLRRAYHSPFWRIEASARRWDWAVAKSRFDATKVDQRLAKDFVKYWRKQLFGETKSARAGPRFIYAPLQGRLLEKRSFQTQSPLDMLKTTLKQDLVRLIHVSLHPRETYSETELQALNRLFADNPRVKLVTGDRKAHLQGCDYVVAENSGLALDGCFFKKPAILFAKIDFHHIAENIAELGVDTAYSNVLSRKRNYDAYLYWFLQQQSINAGRDDAEARILETVRSRGWNI